MIVLEDADLKAAARWGTWGATYHAGQSCVAVERLYVVESVYDEFMALLLAEMKKVKVGSSTERNSPYHYGPLTFDRQLTVIQDHIQDALAKGAEIIYGGHHDHLFMEPTVLVNVDHSMKIMQDETFGPVLPVMKVRDEAEAIRLANDSELGLGACVWSKDIARAERVGRQLEVGTVNINDVISHYAVTQLPFGGVKQSGTARTHGKEEVLQFTQLRSFSVGGTPKVFDLATQLRKPGRYWLGDLLLKTTLGVTPKQKLEPLTDVVQNMELKPAVKRTATGIALVSVAVAFAFHIFRTKE
jgi:acyl-CoA reductase-like NAD-dependent aldehyde dehydrogenase